MLDQGEYQMPRANPTLKGHRLINLFGVTGPPLLVLGAVFQPSWIAQLKDLFPDLEIVSNQDESRDGDEFLKEISEDEWREATIIVTGKTLPEPELLPNLRYIQLQTAGANHMLNHPSVTGTRAALCTASGIHGSVDNFYLINSAAKNEKSVNSRVGSGNLSSISASKYVTSSCVVSSSVVTNSMIVLQYAEFQKKATWNKLGVPIPDSVGQRV